MKTHNLKFLNFYSYYGSQGDIEHNMRAEVCFSHIFHCHELPKNNIIKNVYTIRVCHSGIDIKEGRSNQCYLSLTDIKRYLTQGKKFVNYNYHIRKTKDYYYITADVQDVHLAHKFILTYIRYLYEVPFALYLYEAVRLKHDCPEFKSLDYLTIYNIVSATIPNYGHGTDIHNIGASYTFKRITPIKQIKQYLQKLENDWLNNIFEVVEDAELQTLKVNFNTTEPWKLKKDRQQRIATYVHNYNILKKLRK